MRKILTALLALGIAMSGATVAYATPGDQVCAPLDSGKIDVVGNVKTVTVTAPEGYIITGYCVKAGSVQQGNGPEYVSLNTPTESVTFGHSSGKDVSHYSVSWIIEDLPDPEPSSYIALPPQFADFCGVKDDQVAVPENTTEVTYSITDERVDGVGKVTVVATANDGYVLKFEDGTVATLTWNYQFTNEPCPTTTPTPEPTTPPRELAYTGPNDSGWVLFVVGVILGLAGYGMYRLGRKKA